MRMRIRPDIVGAAIRARRVPLVGAAATIFLRAGGAEIPRSVVIGRGFRLVHGGSGVVIHPKTVIGDRVAVFQGVTIGRADIFRPNDATPFEGIVIEDGVVLCAGAKVLCKSGVLRVARGSIIGANAVLLQSTGENETWVGVPARPIASARAPRPRTEATDMTEVG
jgi:serine O-acetyltransferase